MFSLIPFRKNPSLTNKRYGEPFLFEEFPVLFNRMRNELAEAFDWMYGKEPITFPEKTWKWGLEVKNEPEAFHVIAEAPGFEVGDFKIELRGQELILQAFKKFIKEEKKEKEAEEFHEEQVQEFYRVLTLPAEVNPEKITARYRQGILTVILPKIEPVKGRPIPVIAE